MPDNPCIEERNSCLRISILSPDLSQNNMGRAYLLAKVLERQHEVEIIGQTLRGEIWSPIENDESLVYKKICIKGKTDAYFKLLKLYRAVDGDIVYALKPLLNSLGVGILIKYTKKKPLFIDIDDWQLGISGDILRRVSIRKKIEYLLTSAIWLFNPGSYWNSILTEKLVKYADEITVSNRFLKNRYGGTIIRHGRDTSIFDPSKFDKDAERKRYGVEIGKKVIVFFGTPRQHKGLEDLIDAVKEIESSCSEIQLVLVGIDTDDDYCREIIKKGEVTLGDKFKWFVEQPFDKVPNFLCMADLVVIPQRKTSVAKGQNPAKIFDAMAMAKPIITTDVSDLKEIIEDCGWVIEPGNVGQLASIMEWALNNTEEANKLGLKARQKCIEQYGWDTMENQLEEILTRHSAAIT